MDEDALRDRLVGTRYRNTETDEVFTIIGINPPLLLLQYADGTPYDELMSQGLLSEEQASSFGVSEHGIDDERYFQLSGGGPTLADACDEGEHVFSPSPSELGIDDADTFRQNVDTYNRAARCIYCGLSADTIQHFLEDLQTPEVCHRCSTEILPSEGEIAAYSPTPDWQHATLCEPCTEKTINEYSETCPHCEEQMEFNDIAHQISHNSPAADILAERGTELNEPQHICKTCWEEIPELGA
jgi:hypothetical protein